MDVQQRYWQEFLDLKRDAYYTEFYHDVTERTERIINVITAAASSSAVAGWVIWRETINVFGVNINLSLFWMVIIMASQVINAVKEYLPYKTRLSSLSTMANELNSLALVMESDWYKVSRGLLTEQEINDLHMEIKRKKLQATTKSFPDTSLPENKRLLARADTATISYVQTYFNGG